MISVNISQTNMLGLTCYFVFDFLASKEKCCFFKLRYLYLILKRFIYLDIFFSSLYIVSLPVLQLHQLGQIHRGHL